jgi:hypothetical protein
MAEYKPTRVNSLEQNVAGMKKDIEHIKKTLDTNTKALKEWQKECEQKFAPRWVADAMKFIIGTLMLGVIGAILKIILI